MGDYRAVANPGSALGEAVGASMEKALEKLVGRVADEYGYHYLTAGVRKTKAGRIAKKLLMADNFGNEYDIDGVIANEHMQPLILFESKYIRYKKHNRDKGSWVCQAHSAIRKRYHSIRSSIAILAGSWSQSSIAMMQSHDINIFLIPFDFITATLARYGVDFEWGEKEKEKARAAWEQFNTMSSRQKAEVGEAMIQVIKDRLLQRIEQILDDTAVRRIDKVVLELVSNLGEVKVYEFDSVEAAINFLGLDDLDRIFITADSLTLFDPPPVYDA